MDERITKNVKRGLRISLEPRPVPPVGKRKTEKRKATLEEFDPVAKNVREGPSQFALNKEVEKLHLREYRAVVPDDHRLGGDAMLFLNEMRQDIEAMLHEELIRQHGIKYTIVLTVLLEKLRLSVEVIS